MSRARLFSFSAALLGALGIWSTQAQAAKVHAGEPTTIPRKGVVNVSTLPPPSEEAEPLEVEPEETQPVTKKPRKHGVVEITREGSPGGPFGPIRLAAFKLGFQGISLPEIFGHGGELKFPPDTQVAANANRVVEFVNSRGAIFDHSGAHLTDFGLGSLFIAPANAGGDPKLLYDGPSNHFFASYISVLEDAKGNSEIDLATAADPKGAWTVYEISIAPGLQDQPKLGISSDKIVMSWNDSTGTVYYVLNKEKVVEGAASVPAVFWAPDPKRFNGVPAIQLSPGGTEYGVYHNDNTAKVGVLAFNGVPPGPTNYTDTKVGIAKTSAPPGAPQPPKGAEIVKPLDTGDDRIQSATWQGGDLWVSGGDACKAATDSAARACMRVIHIQTPAVKLTKDVDVTLVGGSVIAPAVTLDASKNLWLSYSAVSPSLFASVLSSEAPGGIIGSSIGGLIFGPGTGAAEAVPCYSKDPRNRFGDYSGASLFPSSGSAGPSEEVWTAAEFARDGCSWGTEIGAFATP